MPNILVLVNTEMADAVKANFDTIGAVLRAETTATFPDLGGDISKVAAMMIIVAASSNAPKIQVLGIANHSENREALLETWKNNLVAGWNTAICSQGLEELRDLLGPRDVEIWPTMPLGVWSLAGPST